jgi:hypothetical protein
MSCHPGSLGDFSWRPASLHRDPNNNPMAAKRPACTGEEGEARQGASSEERLCVGSTSRAKRLPGCQGEAFFGTPAAVVEPALGGVGDGCLPPGRNGLTTAASPEPGLPCGAEATELESETMRSHALAKWFDSKLLRNRGGERSRGMVDSRIRSFVRTPPIRDE